MAKQVLKDIGRALYRLTFADNFESFAVDVTIAASTETPIRNEFPDQKIPTQYLIMSQEGGGHLRKGSTAWTKEYLYLQNVSATDSITATVRFFK